MVAIAVTAAFAHDAVTRQSTVFEGIEQPRSDEVRCGTRHWERMSQAIEVLENLDDERLGDQPSDQLDALRRMYGACWRER